MWVGYFFIPGIGLYFFYLGSLLLSLRLELHNNYIFLSFFAFCILFLFVKSRCFIELSPQKMAFWLIFSFVFFYLFGLGLGLGQVFCGLIALIFLILNSLFSFLFFVVAFHYIFLFHYFLQSWHPCCSFSFFPSFFNFFFLPLFTFYFISLFLFFRFLVLCRIFISKSGIVFPFSSLIYIFITCVLFLSYIVTRVIY